jgi:hypothetical protein
VATKTIITKTSTPLLQTNQLKVAVAAAAVGVRLATASSTYMSTTGQIATTTVVKEDVLSTTKLSPPFRLTSHMITAFKPFEQFTISSKTLKILMELHNQPSWSRILVALTT